MPLPVGSCIVEISVLARLDGQRIINVYHYFADDAVVGNTRAFANQMAVSFHDDYVNVADYRQLFNPLYEIEAVHAQKIYPTRIARGFLLINPAIVGTRAGDPLPSSTQWSVTKFTDEPGVGGHGGNRFAGFNVADVVASIVDPAFIADAGTYLAQIFPQITLNGQDYDACVYRRSNPMASNPVVNIFVEEEVRTMRRRVVGRGE